MIHALRTCLLCLCAAGAWAQTCDRLLQPGDTFPDSATGDERKCYRIQVPAGQVLAISVSDQQGIAGILSIVSPDGTEAAQADLARRVRTQRLLSIVTESAGSYEIRLAPSNHAPLQRRY